MGKHFSLNIDTSRRTDESEIMDDFELNGMDLRRTLKDLENINAWLGGNQISLNGIKKILRKAQQPKTLRIADIGCGNGAMLRNISNWGRKKGYDLELVGIDANKHAIDLARELAAGFQNIEFLELNIFSESFRKMEFDIILCSLTLHHFKDIEIIRLLNQFYQQSTMGVVINDLHRCRLAYILFQAFCAVFVSNEIARKDGLISILRGFKRDEIKRFSNNIPARNHELTWKWAFRYQWILTK